ncbi:MAG: glycerol-3-phosphate 1-O-acyltransferase PlsY [Mycoplasmatales bacterium]|nr:glycerol-3-phosphate 1-O-acyltransferase PlsY [Mycoplasmatales bacterium]
MNWSYLGGTLLFAIIGYLFGSISNAIIISKFFKNEDVRNKESGNAGATNVLRNYGKKLGALVFTLDILKTIIPVFIAWSFREYSQISWMNGIMIQAIGLATVIGHIWPIYFQFKGGKGAASMLGFIIAMQWMIALIGVIVFLGIVFSTKKVSLGSIIAPGILLIFQIIFSFIPHLSDQWSIPMMNYYDWWINTIFFALIYIIVTIRHIPNIKKLLKGEERTINFKN